MASTVDTRPQEDHIHQWFCLTYANYLVLNRSLLQSMPDDWQRRMVELLREMDQAFGDLDFPDRYEVHIRDERGRFAPDPIPHYNRGRTYIEPKAVTR